eukprot:8058087-Pyramimonas_sp.AAC.1
MWSPSQGTGFLASVAPDAFASQRYPRPNRSQSSKGWIVTSTRARSSGRSGLWSSVSLSARPPTSPSTARESPLWAEYSELPNRTWDGRGNTSEEVEMARFMRGWNQQFENPRQLTVGGRSDT